MDRAHDNYIEKIIKAVYMLWKSKRPPTGESHPDEEELCCFLEAKSNDEEHNTIKEHIINCDRCAELISLQAKLTGIKEQNLPKELIRWSNDLVAAEGEHSILEIICKLKQKALEIISTNGDVLVGQELVPAPILRSRNIKDFKDEVHILKDFNDIRVEIKIENKGGNVFSLIIIVRQKETQRTLKDLRVTLFNE
ncbi:MAG: hypothetical protein ABH914_04395, partial [Candidatus Omnitrophota bacterium]